MPISSRTVDRAIAAAGRGRQSPPPPAIDGSRDYSPDREERVRPVTIARNYAETLFALADQAGQAEAWGDLIDETAAAVSTPSIEAVLMSPRVTKERKISILEAGLRGAPPRYVLFLAALVRRGRQMIVGQVADEYRTLLDVKLGRVRAGVTMARDVDALTRSVIVERLAKAIGKDVIAGFSVDPSLLGGVVVKVATVCTTDREERLAVLRRSGGEVVGAVSRHR